jgi:membrane protein DedA with SNARE-associated domain
MNSITHALEAYGLIAVGLLIFLEDFGVPLPGETVLIATAVTASKGGQNILLVALVAFIAAVAGDNVGWVIGHYGGRRVLYTASCRLTIGGRYVLAPSKLRTGERFFRRHGAWIIIIARFIDVLRQLNGIVAGALNTPWRTFLLFNSIGAALWVGTWASIGYFIGSETGQSQINRVLLYVFAGVVFLGVATYLVRRLVRRLRHVPAEDTSREAEDKICRDEKARHARKGAGEPG